MEKAYHLTRKDLTENIEINFEELSKLTDNFIISYHYNDTKYFKRTLFELDRLNLNIGVLIVIDSDNYSIENVLKEFIDSIKGFNINLGVWVDYSGEKDLELYNKLNELFSDNFITGLRYFDNKLSNYSPIWEYNGDIAESGITSFNKTSLKKYKMVFLINNYKDIYKENDLKPVPSNYKF